MNLKIKEVLIKALQTACITGITIAAVLPVSCKVTTEGIEIIGGDYTVPEIEEINVIDSKTVSMSFSDEISVRSLIVSAAISGISDSDVHSSTQDLSPSLASAAGQNGQIDASVVTSEDGKQITFLLNEETKIGKTYEVYGVVEDKIGNTLSFCVPFTGYNSSVPKIIMTELQIKYGKGTQKGETVYRGEYVEFLALEDGNLAGLELFSAADGDSKIYKFPAIDVSKGEVFLLHMRTIGDGCVNEDGEDLNLATAPHSKDGIRDLWSESTTAHFNDSSDVVLLRNSVNGEILDGVMYASIDATEWKTSVGEAAAELASSGIYAGSDISGASCSKGVSTLKSLTRENASSIYELCFDGDFEFPVTADENDWCVESCTPGVL